jgi:hypothetical protein
MVKRFVILGLGCAMATAGLASESPTPDHSTGQPGKSAIKYCDPVCELKSQDAAFGILMEVYRQHQCYRIETDYQIRLLEAGGLPVQTNSTLVIEADSKALRMLRELVRRLARSERELRLAAMETQVANFQAAYGCVRKIDEDYVGERVPRTFNQEAAREKIKDFVVIAPGTLTRGDLRRAREIPASSVLLDLPLGPANLAELVEPCE